MLPFLRSFMVWLSKDYEIRIEPRIVAGAIDRQIGGRGSVTATQYTYGKSSQIVLHNFRV